jgi:AcrR family transcriptional regulator
MAPVKRPSGPPSSGPRSYDNSRRAARVWAVRRRVVDAAGHLFLEHGYPTTTMEAIGAASDTPMATLYRLFAAKADILRAVLESAYVGDDEPLALHDRPDATSAAAETDPRRLLAGYAHLARTVLERSASLQHMLRTAAAVEPSAAELLADNRRQRADGQSRVVTALRRLGVLTPSLTDAFARDIVYGLMSPELHWVLTDDRGWSHDGYEQWLARALCSMLLAA